MKASKGEIEKFVSAVETLLCQALSGTLLECYGYNHASSAMGYVPKDMSTINIRVHLFVGLQALHLCIECHYHSLKHYFPIQ